MSKSGRGGARPGAGRPSTEPTKMMRVPVGAEQLVKLLLQLYKSHDAAEIGDIGQRASRFANQEAEAALTMLCYPELVHHRRLKAHLSQFLHIQDIELCAERQHELLFGGSNV